VYFTTTLLKCQHLFWVHTKKFLHIFPHCHHCCNFFVSQSRFCYLPVTKLEKSFSTFLCTFFTIYSVFAEHFSFIHLLHEYFA